eukprot:2818082-Amphidinium_carterae.1
MSCGLQEQIFAPDDARGHSFGWTTVVNWRWSGAETVVQSLRINGRLATTSFAMKGAKTWDNFRRRLRDWRYETR